MTDNAHTLRTDFLARDLIPDEVYRLRSLVQDAREHLSDRAVREEHRGCVARVRQAEAQAEQRAALDVARMRLTVPFTDRDFWEPVDLHMVACFGVGREREEDIEVWQGWLDDAESPLPDEQRKNVRASIEEAQQLRGAEVERYLSTMRETVDRLCEKRTFMRLLDGLLSRATRERYPSTP